MSSGGGKPVQFPTFGWELTCETTATWKVTVLILKFLLVTIVTLARIQPAWQRYLNSSC